MMPGNLEGQVDILIRLLEGKKLSKSSPPFKRALEWVANFPGEIEESKRRRYINTICDSFDITEAELYATVSGMSLPPPPTTSAEVVGAEAELRRSLPRSGWFESYDAYTRYTESPLSFHIFGSLCILGACLGRRVWKQQGFFNIYPNYCVVLIGPTGRVKKTAAVDIVKNLIHANAVCPIMADKITPEGLASSLVASGHQFMYAPEFSVLFGRQKYNEGLTTLIIRLLDCPEEWKVCTQSRGEETITNIALTVLGGSTMSLLTGSTPTEVTSSGFLNRFLLVLEEDTERIFPEPRKGEAKYEKVVYDTVARMKTHSGEMVFTSTAQKCYSDWYHQRRQELRSVPDEMTAEILQRYPDHLIRTSMLVHLAQCDDHFICEKCLLDAIRMLDYLSRRTPLIVNAINQTTVAADTDYLLTVLKRLGGAADHSKLLRRVSSKMDAAAFKRHLGTLIESKLVKEEKRGQLRYYILREDHA